VSREFLIVFGAAYRLAVSLYNRLRYRVIGAGFGFCRQFQDPIRSEALGGNDFR
jgi:hypothetical protein